MQITKISLQRKNNAFNVFIDGKFSFSLDKESLVKEKLKVGEEVSESRLKDLKFKGRYSYFFARALNFLSFRPRSEKETRDKLKEILYKEKDLEEAVKKKLIDMLLDKLKTLSFINDEEFAKWYIAQRRGRKSPFGVARIKSELIKKGIHKDLISEMLDVKKSEDEEELAYKALEKKMRLFRRLETQEFKRKAYAYLARLGFGWEVISRVVDTIIKRQYNDTGSDNGLEI